MKKIALMLSVVFLALTMCACGPQDSTAPSATTSTPAGPQDGNLPKTNGSSDGRGDLFDGYATPKGATAEIRQDVFYYELLKLSGDSGDGLTPQEGVKLVDDLLASIGLYSENGGIPAEQCVYISFDDLMILDSAMKRECYIYSVALGTIKGGLKGDGYQVIYRISVDYSGKKTAAIYEDFGAAGHAGSGRGDLFDS